MTTSHSTCQIPTPLPGILSLPQELRDQIYAQVVVKDRNTITMLSSSRSEVSASQPDLASVNHQLRYEILPFFYSHNTFLAELTEPEDLAVAKTWLARIGDANVANVGKLALCGWTKARYDEWEWSVEPETISRWVRVVFDLKKGRLAVEGSRTRPRMRTAIAHPLLDKAVADVNDAFVKIVKARNGESFDVESVALLMDGFHAMCAPY